MKLYYTTNIEYFDLNTWVIINISQGVVYELTHTTA
jgi:hypothetical protein